MEDRNYLWQILHEHLDDVWNESWQMTRDEDANDHDCDSGQSETILHATSI